MATLEGIDVSRHQGVVDYGAVRRSGKDFAFIKATDGIAYKWMWWFHANLPLVRAAGLVPGAYHFLLDHHPGAEQARFYVDEVNKAGGFDGVVPVVDIEREADGTTPRFVHLFDFVNEFRRLVPGRPILVYTGKWYWVGVLGNPPGGNLLGPLWHSEYDGRTPIDENVADGPELDNYGGWTSALVWQHTSSGLCPGVVGNCDLNLFYGDRAELLALAGANGSEEDDEMLDTDFKRIEEMLAKGLSWLATGKGNAMVNPTIPLWGWSDDPGTVSLNELMAAVGKIPTVAQIAAAVVAELPAGSPDIAVIEAAVGTALRRVFADAAVPGP